MRTSYSALETYKLCPQKYKFREIDRIPEKKSKATLFGTHIHSVLKFMFSPQPLFPTLSEVLDHFRKTWPSPEKMEVTPEEKELYWQEGERILKNFYEKNAPWNFSVVDLESRFEVIIEDPHRRETHILVGRIDRIDKTPDGYEVIDYKTSRRIPSQAAVDDDLQLALYSLGLQKRWPHLKPEAIKLSLYFLRHGEILTTRRTAEATARTQADVLKTTAEIQKKLGQGERFEPVPGPHCSFCSYKPMCPAWRHLYQKGQPHVPPQEELEMALKEYFDLIKTQRANEKRLGELKQKISAYMDSTGYDRVFGDEGYLTRSHQKRFGYDFKKIRAILEPLGRWQEILTADDRKLKDVILSLPPHIQSHIEDAKTLIKEFTVISISMKKIPAPSPPLSP